jgi:hypothetical protein
VTIFHNLLLHSNVPVVFLQRRTKRLIIFVHILIVCKGYLRKIIMLYRNFKEEFLGSNYKFQRCHFRFWSFERCELSELSFEVWRWKCEVSRWKCEVWSVQVNFYVIKYFSFDHMLIWSKKTKLTWPVNVQYPCPAIAKWVANGLLNYVENSWIIIGKVVRATTIIEKWVKSWRRQQHLLRSELNHKEGIKNHWEVSEIIKKATTII